MSNKIYEKQRNYYASGEPLPWDDVLPPPEVRALIEQRSADRALDLGCGYGRTSIYLAQRDWDVDGIDFIEQAVIEARRRANAANVTPRFHHGDVTKLDFLTGSYRLAIDVGCAHALNSAELTQYITHLARLLHSKADYLLYARLQEAHAEQTGLDEATLLQQFETQFKLLTIDYGERIDFHAPWKSAWLHFQRR